MSVPTPAAQAAQAAPAVKTRRTPAQVQADLKAEAEAKAQPSAASPTAPAAQPSADSFQVTSKGEEKARLYNQGKKTYILSTGHKCLPKRAIILPKALVDHYVKRNPKDLIRYEDLGKQTEVQPKSQNPLEAENAALKSEIAALKDTLAESALTSTASSDQASPSLPFEV